MPGRRMQTTQTRPPITLRCFTSRQLFRRKQPLGRHSYRSSAMPAPKAKKVGRPKLPKGHAKGRVFGLRLTDEEIKNFEAGAKARHQSVSEWMRTTLNVAIEQSLASVTASQSAISKSDSTIDRLRRGRR